MKVGILGDLHIGIKNGNELFMRYQKNYYKNNLFPLIKMNNLQHIIQLGDILDSRKNVDFRVSAFLINFLKWFEENKVHLWVTLGNHDIYFRQSLTTSGLSQYADILDSEYIHIISKPTIMNFDNMVAKMIPWICNENKDEAKEILLKETQEDKTCIFGHFELSGYTLMRGVVSSSGTYDENELGRYKKLFSGHFHTSSAKKNICYVGTPYALTWGDYGDTKGFRILDTETMDVEFFENPCTLYHKIVYEPNLKFYENKSIPEGAFIKLIVTESDDLLDIFINKISETYKPTKIQIIDPSTDELQFDTTLNDICVDSPIKILIDVVKGMNRKDTDFLINEIQSIHKEAKEIQNNASV